VTAQHATSCTRSAHSIASRLAFSRAVLQANRQVAEALQQAAAVAMSYSIGSEVPLGRSHREKTQMQHLLGPREGMEGQRPFAVQFSLVAICIATPRSTESAHPTRYRNASHDAATIHRMHTSGSAQSLGIACPSAELQKVHHASPLHGIEHATTYSFRRRLTPADPAAPLPGRGFCVLCSRMHSRLDRLQAHMNNIAAVMVENLSPFIGIMLAGVTSQFAA